MAKKTGFLGLILPALGEYFNKWNTPVNDNFQKIDDFASAFGSEIETARGSAATLNDRISTAIASDGSLNDVPEVIDARSSKIYGSGSGSGFQKLDSRLEAGDFEMFYGRQSRSTLVDGIAWGDSNVVHNTLVSGPTGPLTISGATVTLNGAVNPVVSNINGYRCVTDINDYFTFPISAASGTYYLYLTRSASGRAVPKPTDITIPVTVNGTGLISVLTSTNKLSKFTAGTGISLAGVKAGDLITVTGVGTFLIAQTVTENPTDLDGTSVCIVGEFPSSTSSGSGFSATFTRQTLPTLGYTVIAPSKYWAEYTDMIYIGRCVYDSVTKSITAGSLITYPYQAVYTGNPPQSVIPVGGDFTLSIPHNLGFIPRRISIYASQASDFSQPLEMLSVAKMGSGSVTLSSGSQTITYTAPTLRRSVIVSFTDTYVFIKNATNGIFYEDFNGNAQTSGYLFVVVER